MQDMSARAHIEDPTLKVKAPTSLLSALGNTHINLIFSAHALEKLLVILTNCSWEDHPEDEVSPTSVIDCAKANQKLAWRIEGLRNRLEDAIGQFEWGDDGQLIRMGNAAERKADGVPPATVMDPEIRSALDNGDGTWTVNGIRYRPVPKGERPKPPPGAGRAVPTALIEEGDWERFQAEVDQRWKTVNGYWPPRADVEQEVADEWGIDLTR